jgi:hypothetical protein
VSRDGVVVDLLSLMTVSHATHHSPTAFGRWLRNNLLSGAAPSWICGVPSYDLRNNTFACPLPRCCSSFGDGLCAPCFNITAPPPPPPSAVDCCTYTNATTHMAVGVQCGTVDRCASPSGVDLTLIRKVDSCGACFALLGVPPPALDCCVYANDKQFMGAECTPVGKCVQSPDLVVINTVSSCTQCLQLEGETMMAVIPDRGYPS